MALEVEDGTGKANADALVSVDDVSTYAAAYGLTDWTDAPRSPADDDEAAIREASSWLSTAWRYKGARVKGRLQGQAFPREQCTDAEGDEIPSDEVPVEIHQACCVAATYARANPGALSPAVTITNRIKREKVGPLETEYFYSPMTPDSARPTLTKVMDLIGGLLAGSGNMPLVGRTRRG